jgi:LysM repeat protein
MKKILAWLLIATLAATVAQAQESATDQQLDKLSQQIQDIEAAQAAQEKHISDLEKEISDLRGQMNQSGTGFASQDDLQKIAQQVQEIDKKRQDDNDRVLKELERLEKSLSMSPPSRRPLPDISPDTTATPSRGHPGAATGGTPQTGYDYTVQKGDTLMAIVKAYREQGIKVTTEQVLKANPGLDPKTMRVGQKLFIPAPGQQ